MPLTTEQAREYMHKLLAAMVKAGGSDLFIAHDFPPSMKANGQMTPLTEQKLTGAVTEKLKGRSSRLRRMAGPAIVPSGSDGNHQHTA